jgi:hypothetical protein
MQPVMPMHSVILMQPVSTWLAVGGNAVRPGASVADEICFAGKPRTPGPVALA